MNASHDNHIDDFTLYEVFAEIPIDDINKALIEVASEIWANGPWREYGYYLKSLEKVESYLKMHQANSVRHELIKAFLTEQKPYYEQLLWLPERRPRVIELDRDNLEGRQRSLEAGNTFSFLDDVKNNDTVEKRQEYINECLQEVGRRLQILNTQRPSELEYSTLQKSLPRTLEINTNIPKPELLSVSNHPWAEIEALAERIGLRRNGAFIPSPKWIAAAVAGMIDALCEAEVLPPSGELKRLYADFSHHYGRKVGADRLNDTRLNWQKKARKELGLA